MNWLYYLLEANLYLVVFYGMYKLLLQHSTFYNSNRYFILLSVVAAFAIPLIQLDFLKPQLLLQTEVMPYEIPLETLEISTIAQAPALTAQDYIFYGYLALALFLSLKFIISISKIVTTYLHSNKRKLNDYTLVELSSEHTAFSFFNILFIHPTMAKNEAVLKHEIVHIKHKHSWDILLLELLKICCWFNPIVYLLKKDITLLHEYIADEKTTAANITKHEYAMFLIENSMAAYSSSLVNQLFNQSILKSRINMLNKEKTANWARLKYLLAVPLGVGLLCVSTLSFSKSYGFLEIGTQKQVFQQTSQKAKNEEDLAKKGRYSPSYIFDENKNYKSLEKRLIVINGVAVEDNDKYYGSNKADKILFLDSKTATAKYGSKGKEGAIEIYGTKSVLVYQPPYVIADTAKFPAPKMKKDQVKFPLPKLNPYQKAWFTPLYKKDKSTGKPILSEHRYILINDKEVENLASFYGVSNADRVRYLTKEAAITKYGDKGKNGAVVITGTNIKYFDKVTFPKAPPVEPPPPGYKTKRDQVKFPPPIVKPDQKQQKTTTKQGENQEIEIVAVSKQNEVVVQGYQASEKNQPTQKVIGTSLEIKADKNQEVVVTGYKVAQKSNKEKLKNEIEEVQGKLVEKNKLPEIEIVPVQKVKGIKLEEKNTPEKEVIITGYKISEKNTPIKKVQGLKLTPKTTKDKTSSLKRVSNYQTQDHQKATTTKATQQKTNNVFSKAWTLYKPKVEENKNDNC